MSSAEDFLREERDRLQLKLQEAKIVFAHAKEEVLKIEERIKYCDELLERIEQDRPPLVGEGADNEQVGLTIPDLVHLIIENRGPSTVPEIQRGLKELGEITSINSLWRILNALRGKTFDKDQEGRWSIKVKDDAAEHEVALDAGSSTGDLAKPAPR
ncbi:MAG TPA: hypothetical protein VMC85_21900 [Desulfomonilaceae bacterium]|nr:hypothetical protein [Desulfomonilaceae bacterium]